jgi:hypothetical protein
MRLIKLLDEGDQADSWIKIRPLIVSFVSEVVLDSIVDDLQQLAGDEIDDMQQQDSEVVAAVANPLNQTDETLEDEKPALNSGFEQFETASSLFNAEQTEGE